MSGNRFLLDTNTVLYLLGGKLKSKHLPDGDYIISFINELELLSYPNLKKSEETEIEKLINDIEVIDLNQQLKKETVNLRKKYRLKLPDAIICATALFEKAALVTFDESLFKVKELKAIKPE